MKRLLIIPILFFSVAIFGQDKKTDSVARVDSISQRLSLPDLQIAYEALNGSNLPHQAVMKLLAYIEQEYRIQTSKQKK